MSNERQETIADIVAQMRLGVKDWRGERVGVFDCFADRIEAAHKREMADEKRISDAVIQSLRDKKLEMAGEIARLNRKVYEYEKFLASSPIGLIYQRKAR